MFHCNGWCNAWAVTAAAGTHVCMRAVRGDEMWRLIEKYAVTNMCGAPTVIDTLISANDAHPLSQSVTCVIAGAPPPPATIAAARELNIDVLHAYGLTETYGPYSVCEPQKSWDVLDARDRATATARQGVGMITAESLRVVREDIDEAGALQDVAADGAEIGELVMRGNGVMKEYFKDAESTAKAFIGGWFHSGDLGVMHPDRYVQIVDRSKDIIISGGENISSIEVENALRDLPSISKAAVIGISDQKWGERPAAFLVSRYPTDAEEVKAGLRAKLAGYKIPSVIVFVDDLPTTATGKIRKDTLRSHFMNTR